MAPGAFDAAAEQARLEGIAPAYDAGGGSPTEEAANRFAAARAVREVRGPRVLVLGAATACWAEPLIERFGGFETVDAVAELVERIEARWPGRVRGHTALFERFEPPEGLYDTVVMGHVLEHVLDPIALLRRARSWLAGGGRIVILVPHAGSLHRRVGVEMGLLSATTDFSAGDVALGHRRVYTLEGLRSDVVAAGLTCAGLHGLVLKPLSNAQMDGWSEPLRDAWFRLGEAHPELACVAMCVATSEPP